MGMTRFSNLVVPKRLDGSLPNSMAPRALIYDPQQVPCESPCPSRKIVVSRVQPSNQKGLAILCQNDHSGLLFLVCVMVDDQTSKPDSYPTLFAENQATLEALLSILSYILLLFCYV